MADVISRDKNLCQECGAKAYGGPKDREPSWVVADKVWKAAGYKPSDVAYEKCLAKRLRKSLGLKQRDFTSLLVAATKKLK